MQHLCRKITCVSLLLAIAGAPGTSPAEQDEAEPELQTAEDDFQNEIDFLQNEGEVESAARHRQAIGMSPSAITVITREDVETSGANTIPDLLRLVPGMDVVVSSPAFTAITSRLYWTNQNFHYLVLIDGREANLELLGSPPWEQLAVSIEDVERIEVIRGPGSALYGANAVAGVISITTRSAWKQTSGWAQLRGGEAGLVGAAGQVNTRFGDVGLSINGGIEDMGEFTNPHRLGKKIWRLRTLGEVRFSNTQRLIWEGGLSRGRGYIATLLGRIEADLEIGMVRVAYDSEGLKAHLSWDYAVTSVEIPSELRFGGLRLATFAPAQATAHIIDGQLQWTLPEFWAPLLVIVGGGGKFSWLSSGEFLDETSFSDKSSPNYHQPGIEYFEGRLGTFVQGELTPVNFLTMTCGVRLDYNTETGFFLSPRIALVFQPLPDQFIRLGAARAFHQPAFSDTRIHPMVEFPKDSPIQGTAQESFQEFMSRVVGNKNLKNEELTSFEVGYLGQFFDSRLQINLDLYYNIYRNRIGLVPNIIQGDQGLPDLTKSQLKVENEPDAQHIMGGEMHVGYSPSSWLSFTAWWAHRLVYLDRFEAFIDLSPKDLLGIGGRLHSPSGLVGSLYLFYRSGFEDNGVENPAGLLEPIIVQQMDPVFLFFGRLGFEIALPSGFKLETGIKLLLPFVPSGPPYFRFYEKGGGLTAQGEPYGGSELSRMLTLYLQGSF